VDNDLFETLERRVDDLLGKYNALKHEHAVLKEENQKFRAEREQLKSRFDAIIGRLEGI